MNNKKAIELFAKDISCLDDIKKEISNFNFFEILKIDQVEIRHSNMLAWLLDPNSESGIGEKLLKRMVYYCIENAPEQQYNLSPTEIEVMDFDDVEVWREKETDNNKHIDLLIESFQSSLVICIENKINSVERKDKDDTDGQLKEYKKYVEKAYKESEYKYQFFVFLTPSGIEASDDNAECWITMSYNEIYNWLTSIIDTYKTSINDKALFFINEYLNNLSRNVIDTRLKSLCDRIYLNHVDAFKTFEQFKEGKLDETGAESKLYYRHKQAIDFILEKKTSLMDLIKDSIRDGLVETGYRAIFSANRAPIYIKAPQTYYENVDPSIVKPNDTWIHDYLYYQIYYYPSSGVFYLQLYTKPENLPKEELWGKLENAFHQIGTRKNKKKIKKINTKNQLSSQRLTKEGEIEDYIKYLKEKNNANKPSKEDDFIKKIVNNAIGEIQSAEHEKFWNALQ